MNEVGVPFFSLKNYLKYEEWKNLNINRFLHNYLSIRKEACHFSPVFLTTI